MKIKDYIQIIILTSVFDIIGRFTTSSPGAPSEFQKFDPDYLGYDLIGIIIGLVLIIILDKWIGKLYT